MNNKLNLNQKLLKDTVISFFERKKDWKRKELINGMLGTFDLTAEERRDTKPDSRFNRIKSNIGSVISQMISDGDLVLDQTSFSLSLTKSAKMLINENEVEEYVLSLFNKKSKITFGEILKAAKIKFRTNKTEAKEDDEQLHAVVKDAIARLRKNKKIKTNKNYYVLAPDGQFPATPIGFCVANSHNGKVDIAKSLVEAINIMGGEFFEIFSVKLLEQYFKVNNYTVLSSNVTGGANDKGIDGIIHVVDDLGYEELVFIQSKVRAKALVTLNEVRQFMGAVAGEKGTRGIFITNNLYHPEAGRFIKQVHNLIGIDKQKLIHLATTYRVGVIEKNGKLVLDDKLFIQNK